MSITGMTCQNCVKHTREALEEVEGVLSVKVDLDSNSAEVECNESVGNDVLKEAVTEAGYDVTKVE